MDEKRKEYKFKVTSLELSKFMERFSSRLNKLHPDRQIMSLYMDTHDFYITTLHIHMILKSLNFVFDSTQIMKLFIKKLNTTLKMVEVKK